MSEGQPQHRPATPRRPPAGSDRFHPPIDAGAVPVTPDHLETILFHFSNVNFAKTMPILSSTTMAALLQSLRDVFVTGGVFRKRAFAGLQLRKLTEPKLNAWQPTIALLPAIDDCVSTVVEIAMLRGIDIKIDISPMVSRHVNGEEGMLRAMLVSLLMGAIGQRSHEAIVLVVERNDLRGPDVVRFVVASRDMKRKQYAQEIPFYPLDETHFCLPDTHSVVPALAAWRDNLGRVAGDLGLYPNINGAPAMFFNLRLPRSITSALT
jgi:hypothetical protein